MVYDAIKKTLSERGRFDWVLPHWQIVDKPGEKCAVVGVSGEHAAYITLQALDTLTHRGQDATGIAALGPGGRFDHYGGRGLVRGAYDSAVLKNNTSTTAVGHNLYSTHGNGKQPTDENDGRATVAHNGHLPHTERLQADLGEPIIGSPGVNDSKGVSLAFGRRLARGATMEEAAVEVYSLIADAGSFCIVAADQSGNLAAMRDPFGFRPLSIGRRGDGFVVASETVALDRVGAEYWRDVEPGELVIFDENGPRSHQLAEATEPKLCMTEFVYVAHPDSVLLGRVVRDVRREFGRQLAREHPAEADIVIGVPNTATPAAQGYAEESGIEYVEALRISPEYAGIRSFMRGTQAERRRTSTKKIEHIAGTVGGERVVVVDDSVFRGTVQTTIMQLLRDGGAKDLNARIASSEVISPNGLGVATPTNEELIAYGRNTEQIRAMIGADSLGYLSVAGMVEATGLPMERFSLSDFTGQNVIEEIHNGQRRLLVAI